MLKCPYCYESLEEKVVRCPHCSQFLIDDVINSDYPSIEKKACLFCGEKILKESKICRYCYRWLDEVNHAADDLDLDDLV